MVSIRRGVRRSVILEAGRWRWRFCFMRTRSIGFRHDYGCPGFRAGAGCLALGFGLLTGIRRNA